MLIISRDPGFMQPVGVILSLWADSRLWQGCVEGKKKAPDRSGAEASYGTRTRDIQLGKLALYQLSQTRILSVWRTDNKTTTQKSTYDNT